VSDAYTAAFRILQYRFNSEHELRRKLAAKRHEPAEIDAAIERLRKEGWIDDERFAGAFARSRAAKKIGPARIRRELSAAGVARDVADRAVAENIDAERANDDLRDAAEKRRRLLIRRHGEEYLASREGKMKLVSYLIKQGYAIDQVRDIIDHEDG
jgi:regulatory protein